MVIMANINSLGIGTGVDLQDMLSKIIAAERGPITNLQKQVTSTNSKISLYGTLNTKLDALKTAADTWRFPSRLSAVSAESSDSSVVKGQATFTATQGSYAVQVSRLASAQKSFSIAYAANSSFSAADVANGKITVSVAGTTTDIDLSDQASFSLEEISARINNAKLGVSTTVINTADGKQRMVLTGQQTGDDQGFSLTTTLIATGGQASFASVDFDTTTDELARSPARNALMTIDGIEVSSATNTFSSTIKGLTLTAEKEGSSTINVGTDQTKIKDAVKALVDAYNGVATVIKTNSSYDSTLKTAQGFSGDAVVRSVMSQLGATRTSVPPALSSANIKALYELGITVQSTGQLSIDQNKLDKAIKNSPSDVINTLQAYGEAFSSTIQSMQSSNGLVSNKVTSLKNSVTRSNANIEVLEKRLEMMEKRYRAQFTALDKYVSSMQTTSSYLGQQLAIFSNNS